MRHRRPLPVLVVACALALAAHGTAAAAPKVDGVFPLAGVTTNGQLTVGPDGNVWVALEQAVGRVTPVGGTTALTTGGLADALGTPAGGITAAGGFVWVSQTPGAGQEAILRIPPSAPASATGVPVTGITAGTSALTTGPDGNVWAALTGKVVTFSPTNPAAATTYPVAGLSPKAIASSGDGTLWVTDTANGGRLLNVTTAGAVTPYTVGGLPQFLATSPAGQVVFGNPVNNPQQIGRLVPGGLPIALDRPNGSDPFGVTFGADGAFWVAEFAGNRLARVTTDGVLTTLGGFPVVAGQGPRQITTAPGGVLWATLDKPGDGPASKIARITGVDAPTGSGGTPSTGGTPPDTTPPTVAVALTRTRFRVGAAPTAVAAARARRAAAGTTITVTLSEAATVRLAVERRVTGRRGAGGRCLAPSARTRRATPCRRWVASGILTRSLGGGVTAVPFSGRVGKRALAPGAHRVTAAATDAAGLRGSTGPVAFTIVRR